MTTFSPSEAAPREAVPELVSQSQALSLSSSSSSSSAAAAGRTITNPSSLSSRSALTYIIEICGTLKRLKRQGWVLRRVPHPESVSDHMHRVALISMLYHSTNDDNNTQNDGTSTTTLDELDYTHCPQFHPDQIDPVKLLRMAVTHDICEAIAGDITPHCTMDVDNRVERERVAMQHITRIVGGSLGLELANLWQEYEDQSSPIAMVVKDIDKFEMLVQAFEYEQEHLVECPATTTAATAGGHTETAADTTLPATTVPSADDVLPLVLPIGLDEPLCDFFQRNPPGCMQTPLFQKLDAELRQCRRTPMLTQKQWFVAD